MKEILENKIEEGSLVFRLLKYVRLVMFWLLGAFYIFTVNHSGKTGWILLVIMVFTINHFIYYYPKAKNFLIWWLAIDFIACFSFGLLTAEIESLAFVTFGVFGTTLFISTNNNRIIYTYGLLFLIACLILILHRYHYLNEFDLIGYILNFMFIIFCSVVGALIRHLAQARQTISEQFEKLNLSHDALQTAHEQLRNYADEVERLTTVRERNHIAREIHDTVGHNLTALLVQLQVARALRKQDPDRCEEALQNCERLAREALQEVRLSVRTLHDEEKDQLGLVQAIQKMLSHFSEMTNIETSLQIEGNPINISPTVQPVIQRMIQESLTNAKRHGEASQIEVKINCTEEKVGIEIIDNGRGTENVSLGFGLINIRERIQELGGSIVFTSEKGNGFSIKASFPFKQKRWKFGGENHDTSSHRR